MSTITVHNVEKVRIDDIHDLTNAYSLSIYIYQKNNQNSVQIVLFSKSKEVLENFQI